MSWSEQPAKSYSNFGALGTIGTLKTTINSTVMSTREFESMLRMEQEVDGSTEEEYQQPEEDVLAAAAALGVGYESNTSSTEVAASSGSEGGYLRGPGQSGQEADRKLLPIDAASKASSSTNGALMAKLAGAEVISRQS
jgi:hypothetical protein